MPRLCHRRIVAETRAIAVSLLITIILIGGLSYIERRRSDPFLYDAEVFWLGFVVRVIGAIAFVATYDFYYDNIGDSWYYNNYAGKLYDVFKEHPGAYFKFIFTDAGVAEMPSEPRSAFFIKLLSFVFVITGRNDLAIPLWFAFFSFWCSYQLVKKIDAEFPSLRVAARVALLFTPSVVFWTSGILKETVAFGALAMLVSYFISIIRGKKIGILTIAGILFYAYPLIALKYYWAAVLIPCMFTGLVIHWAIEKRLTNTWTLTGCWLGLFLMLSLVASLTHPNFHLDRFLDVIVENHDIYVHHSNRNIIHYYNLSPNWLSVLINSPLALWSGLFRPLFFDASSATAIVASIENLLILVLVVWKLFSLRMPSAENRLIVLTTLMYIIILCIFLALSTPNFGTLSRYRVGFLPFFVLMILADHPVFKLKILINKK